MLTKCTPRFSRSQIADHLNTRWLRTVRKTESSNNFPFFQPNDLRRVWLVRLANDRKAETMQCYMAQRAERVDVHACKTLSSGLREASFWPKNGLRSNLIASKFQKFSGGGGGMPPDPPSCCLLTHALLT